MLPSLSKEHNPQKKDTSLQMKNTSSQRKQNSNTNKDHGRPRTRPLFTYIKRVAVVFTIFLSRRRKAAGAATAASKRNNSRRVEGISCKLLSEIETHIDENCNNIDINEKISLFCCPPAMEVNLRPPKVSSLRN